MSRATETARKEYYRQWRAKNKDKIRKYNIRYWERREMREQMQEREKQNNGDNKAVLND